MDCADEAALIRHALASPGILSLNFDLVGRRVDVTFNPDRISAAAILEAVAATGLTAHTHDAGDHVGEDRDVPGRVHELHAVSGFPLAAPHDAGIGGGRVSGASQQLPIGPMRVAPAISGRPAGSNGRFVCCSSSVDWCLQRRAEASCRSASPISPWPPGSCWCQRWRSPCCLSGALAL